MPLTTSLAQSAAAEILGELRHMEGDYSAAAIHLNRVTAAILALDNAALAEFGNNLGPVEMQRLTTMHGMQGEGVNSLLAGVRHILAEAAAGVSLPVPETIPQAVDVRSLSDKLAEQGREILMDPQSGVFSVAVLPTLDPEENE